MGQGVLWGCGAGRCCGARGCCRGSALRVLAKGAGARGNSHPWECQSYKKIQTLSISFPIKYSLLRTSAREYKPPAVPTLCCSNNGVLWEPSHFIYTGPSEQCPARGAARSQHSPSVMGHTRCTEHWAAQMGPAPLGTPQKSSKPPHFHQCLPCPGKSIRNHFIPDLFYQGSSATSHFQQGQSRKPGSADTK